MEKMGDDTNISIYVFGGGGGGGSRRIPGKIRQDIKPVDELRKNDDGNSACLDAAASKMKKEAVQVEEFTVLHKLINDKHFTLALEMLKDAKVDAKILAIAPKQGKIGPGHLASKRVFDWVMVLKTSGMQMEKRSGCAREPEKGEGQQQTVVNRLHFADVGSAAHCKAARTSHNSSAHRRSLWLILHRRSPG